MQQLNLLSETLAPAVARPVPAPALVSAAAEEKSPGAFKNISEAASALDVPQHVLRFWESRFTQIKPLKTRGGRRYYRPEDIEILSTIKHLLYSQGYTIEGAKKAFATLMRGRKAAEHPAREPVVQTEKKEARLSEHKRRQILHIRDELLGLREALEQGMSGAI